MWLPFHFNYYHYVLFIHKKVTKATEKNTYKLSYNNLQQERLRKPK